MADDVFAIGGSWRSTAAPATTALMRAVQVFEGRVMCHMNRAVLRLRSITDMPPHIVVWYERR